jgi:phospholipid/cholesterol/gamma-HCH transport system substrate-binding protein
METRANYILIGLFTMAVVAAAFGFVFWFQNTGGGGERAQFRVVFDGSVSGLRTGANVLFNGIRVGEVAELGLDAAHPKQVTATISVDKSVPVRADTEVGLEYAGLTGVAALTLTGGGTDSPILTGDKDNPPVLRAPAGATRDITQAARDTMRKLDEFIEENRKTIRSALENIDKFTGTLARNAEHVDSTLKNIDQFTGVLARNSERIDKITQGIQNLAGGEDGKGGQLNEAALSVRKLSDTTAKKIEALSADAERTLGTINRAAGSIDRAVRNFDANPSRLIWGGPPPTPQKRRRR